jgi:hypothetical protein
VQSEKYREEIIRLNLFPTKQSHIESIRVSSTGQEGGAEAIVLAAPGLGGGFGLKLRVSVQKGGDHITVFVVAERASGVNEEATRGDVRSVGRENLLLGFSERGNRGRLHIPFQVRLATPRAGARAGCVHEYARVVTGCFVYDGDVGQAGPLGAIIEFIENLGANISRLNLASGADEAGELEGFTTGSSAGVKPAFAASDGGAG